MGLNMHLSEVLKMKIMISNDVERSETVLNKDHIEVIISLEQVKELAEENNIDVVDMLIYVINHETLHYAIQKLYLEDLDEWTFASLYLRNYYFKLCEEKTVEYIANLVTFNELRFDHYHKKFEEYKKSEEELRRELEEDE